MVVSKHPKTIYATTVKVLIVLSFLLVIKGIILDRLVSLYVEIVQPKLLKLKLLPTTVLEFIVFIILFF